MYRPSLSLEPKVLARVTARIFYPIRMSEGIDRLARVLPLLKRGRMIHLIGTEI
jgi:hypothetical protein